VLRVIWIAVKEKYTGQWKYKQWGQDRTVTTARED
jgi:hypothetical protein